VTAGALTITRPTTGVAQSVMVALDSTRGIVSIGQGQAVDGVVLLRPKSGQNYIQSAHPDVCPIILYRRTDQRAALLALLDGAGAGIGGIDKDGRPYGSLAPTVAQQIPAGAFMYYFGAAPSGWIEANGQAIDPAFTVLRSKFGANMPDWRGRFVIAANPVFTLGSGGGAYSVGLVASNMPNELQIVTSVGMERLNNRPGLDYVTATDGSHTTVTSTTFRGGSTPISIMPPWVAMTLICKTG
jgi:microcystin-dependent protein